jgi:chromosome segregation ATPase
MLHPPSLDAVHSSLDPVEALRGEQSQLEAWVRESTVALEALNEELTEWQRDLARQQAELDQREAALQEAELLAAAEGRSLASLEAELEEHRTWAGELREVRRLLRQHGSMLVSLGATLPTDDEDQAPADQELAADDDTTAADAAARAADLRQRVAAGRTLRRPS